jgi:hypothetical protein
MKIIETFWAIFGREFCYPETGSSTAAQDPLRFPSKLSGQVYDANRAAP